MTKYIPQRLHNLIKLHMAGQTTHIVVALDNGGTSRA